MAGERVPGDPVDSGRGEQPAAECEGHQTEPGAGTESAEVRDGTQGESHLEHRAQRSSQDTGGL